MIILSIETSCDDTSIAAIETTGRKRPCFNILANIVSSQSEIHAPFGGIVPGLAARAHRRNLPVVLEEIYGKIQNQGIKINLITITIGPGLEPSLWAGIDFAKSLSLVSGIPILGVNHIEGHICANFIHKISAKSKIQNPKSKVNSKLKIQNSESFEFPAIVLVVSGGHTQLILMKKIGDYKLLGETRDDAAGEAFDKVAKLLGLGYPGGPIISKLADKVLSSRFQVPDFRLPRPMINSKDYDFSFSGLKTAVLYKIEEIKKSKKFQVSPPMTGQASFPANSEASKFQEAICAEFQQAVIDVLLKKTLRAAREYGVKTILCGGGVMANEELRLQLKMAVQNELPNISLRIPPADLCTDNAVMTGIAGYYKFIRYGADKMGEIKADGNLKI